MNNQMNAVIAIAQRDVTKLLKDRVRLSVSLAFPILVIIGLGAVLDPIGGHPADTDRVLVTGILAATLFQSAAAGMLSLVQDRESDYSQVVFVAPIARWAIVTGKVAGESLVALVQGVGIVVFAAMYGIGLDASQLAFALPAALVSCLLGASFGLVTLALLPNQQAGLQVLPFLVLPQYFLAGVISPVLSLPGYLAFLSWLMPMRYGVDVMRAAALGSGRHSALMEPPLVDAAVILILLLAFLGAGAFLLDRRERNR